MKGRLSKLGRLNLDEYRVLRREIRSPKDFDRFQIPNYVLPSILTQKFVESVIKRFRMYKPERIARIWKEKKTLNIRLPPVLRLKLLLKGLGYSKSEIANILKNPHEAGDLEDLVWSAVTKDFIYSPIAVKFQTVKGKVGERLIERFLSEIDVDFKTESELNTKKTPDFLISEKVNILGFEAKWIESKFMFGDFRTHSLYWRRQYYHYFKEFGKGIVVYWCWHLDIPFALGGEVDMSVHFKFGRLKREDFLKTLEKVLDDFERGRRI